MKFISVPVDGGKAHIFIETGMIVWDFGPNKATTIELNAADSSVLTSLSAKEVLALISALDDSD